MKLFKQLIFTSVILVFLFGCDSETPEKAIVYHKSVVDKINILTLDKEAKLIKSLDNFVPDSISIYLIDLEKYISMVDKDFETITDFYGDESLIKEGKKTMLTYKKTLPLYQKVVANESLTEMEYTDENARIYTELMDQIDANLNSQLKNMKKASEKFSKIHKVKLLPEIKTK